MLEAKGFLLGSSTHDNSMLPTMAAFMHFLKGLRPKNRVSCVFGSFGWAGGAVKEIEGVLKETGIEAALPGISVKYAPDETELKGCYEYGKKFAGIIKGGG
jgi:anaerobic nitric oxide reductase flavorubredoxin